MILHHVTGCHPFDPVLSNDGDTVGRSLSFLAFFSSIKGAVSKKQHSCAALTHMLQLTVSVTAAFE